MYIYCKSSRLRRRKPENVTLLWWTSVPRYAWQVKSFCPSLTFTWSPKFITSSAPCDPYPQSWLPCNPYPCAGCPFKARYEQPRLTPEARIAQWKLYRPLTGAVKLYEAALYPKPRLRISRPNGTTASTALGPIVELSSAAKAMEPVQLVMK